MPRPWSEYSPRELARLRPFVERYKHARYKARVALLERARPVRGNPDALRQRMAGRNVLVTVAFNEPVFVAWQAALVRRHLPPVFHLIADNSTDEAASRRMEEAAAASDCGYVRLRPSPWTTPQTGGCSHGLAMNWAWRNLVRPARPAAFGFLDHDIFPMRPTDPFAPLATRLVAGQARNRSGAERWYLWAGFCFFRFDAAKRRGLDFSLDWAAGLDTGGGNWPRLYRRLGPTEVFDWGVELEPIDPELGVDIARMEWIGPWLHAGNFSTPLTLAAAERERIAARKREILERRVAAALEPA